MEGHYLEVPIFCVISLLITYCSLSKCTDLVGQNLVQNPSFEEQEKWDFKQKIGMWKVENASNQQIRYVKDDMIKKGGHVLEFTPVPERQIEAIWASQFIPLYNNKEQQYLFKFSYNVRGKESFKLKAKLDISYKDKTNLFVSTQNDQANIDEFSMKCIIIPAYGIVQATMVHFVLEDKITHPIYLDDVDLQVISTMSNSNCEVYVKTLPNNRLVVPNFLTPIGNELKENVQITLATQMTIDRLQYLVETSKIWQGPISVTLLLLEDTGLWASNTLKAFVTKYYTEELLYKFVSVHVVADDKWNNEDSTMYPVNFLRNIAINFVTTSYVFLIDADISPNFSESNAQHWVYDAIKNDENCKKCAFIIPLFHIKQSGPRLPENKEELIRILKNPEKDYAVVEAFGTASHAVVQYHKWYNANEPYQVNYKQDMEPYFIVHSDAPMMNSMYRGYGRDKCAYSRDLHSAGYKFVVLTEGFLLNKPTLQGGTTMLQRSRGLKLHVFLTIAFHLEELKHGVYTWPDYKTASCNVGTSCHSNDAHTNTGTCDTNKQSKCHSMYEKEHNVAENMKVPQSEQMGDVIEVGESQTGTEHSKQDVNKQNKNADNKDAVIKDFSNTMTTDDSLNCNNYKTITKHPIKTDNTRNFLQAVPRDRKEILVEKVMKLYGTYTYVELPSLNLQGVTRIMLPFVHPEALITINPNFKVNEVKQDGVFYRYQSTENIPKSLIHVRKEHDNEPCTVVLRLDSEFFNDNNDKIEAVKDILQILTDADVFIIECLHCNVKHIIETMCKVKATWQLFTLLGKTDFLILKSISLSEHPPLKNIPLPAISYLKEEPICEKKTLRTDIIMVTKNRPLQTLAFLESLNLFIQGVSKVWIIYKSDDALFDQGYDLIKNLSLAFYFDVQFLEDPGKGEFGNKILHALKSSESDCTMFGVDEIIWLREHNLQKSCCLLQDYEIASVQLRLGKNLFIFPPNGKVGELLLKDRFFPLKFNNNIYVYYPCFWPYDLGYVVQIDGLMMRRQNVLDELEEHLPDIRLPSNLEQRWSLHQLHNHVRKWHIMYDKSLLVNNMWLQDGRVVNKAKPIPESYQLAKMFLNDRKKINVQSFVNKHKDHITTTHMKNPVEFINH